jgi:1,4-dihydroxy-6-naphthoate synthase
MRMECKQYRNEHATSLCKERNVKLKVGISPCPNDTFIFYHLLNDRRFSIDLTVADIEELNRMALRRELDISKVSSYAACLVQEHYQLLDAGAAVGKSCGPLLVARKEEPALSLPDARVGIPGRHTTAHLLYSLYANNRGTKEFMPFNRIMPALSQGLIDLGVIIHEGRFTYGGYSLKEVADLGVWWEGLTGLPIPLGGIIARRNLPSATISDFTAALRESILKASTEKGNTDAPLYDFIRKHAQEMEAGVINRHIDLYVNEHSLSLTGGGNRAFEKLFSLAEGLSL